MAVHMAAICGIRGADAAVEAYLRDVNTDFHTMVANMAGIRRSEAKIINLGMMYGMGLAKLIAALGLSEDEGKRIVNQYRERLPWLSGITELASSRASTRGFIRMIDGCRAHFNLWEPARSNKEVLPMRYEDALRHEENWAATHRMKPRRLVRAGTHKAFNALVQGSSARQTKIAMINAHEAGLPLLLQMHDDLNISAARQSDGERLADIMRDAVRLRVPMKVDLEYGRTWARAKHTWEERMTA